MKMQALARYAELGGEDVDEGRLVPLAAGLGHGVEVQVALGIEAREHFVPGRASGAAGLEETRHAYAAQPTGARRLRAARGEPRPVGERERLVHHRGELAAVVGGAVGGFVGHGIGRDEIPAPQLDRVEPVFGRGVIDEAFDGAGDVRPPGAAVGGHRRGVRVGESRTRVQRGDAIDAAHGDGEIACADQRAEHGGVGAEVGAIVETDGEEAPAGIERDLARERQRAAVVLRQEQFRARRHPFHRAPEFLCREHQRDRLGIDAAAHAEAAADVARDHAQPVRRYAGHLQQLAAHVVDALARRIYGYHPAPGVAVGDAGARFYRAADQALAVHGHAAGERRARERRLDRRGITRFIFEGDVARRLGVQFGRAGARRVVETHRRRQVLVIDCDVFGRILRQQRAVGHDQRQRLAGVMHAVASERRPERLLHFLSADAVESDTAGERLESGRIQIGGGEHQVDARPRARRLGVDAANYRVGAVGAQHAGVELPRQVPVGRVAAPAGEQAFVFAADGLFSQFTASPGALSLRKIGRSVSGGRAGT